MEGIRTQHKRGLCDGLHAILTTRATTNCSPWGATLLGNTSKTTVDLAHLAQVPVLGRATRSCSRGGASRGDAWCTAACLAARALRIRRGGAPEALDCSFASAARGVVAIQTSGGSHVPPSRGAGCHTPATTRRMASGSLMSPVRRGSEQRRAARRPLAVARRLAHTARGRELRPVGG
jgi:hypothetical protein